MKLSKLMLAASVAAAGLVGFGGVADAAPNTTSAAVACVNGDGVLSLLLTNPAADAGAEFVVTNPQTFVTSVVDLDPGASQTVTMAGLADGAIVVPVRVNGNDVSVAAQISCDPFTCSEGAPAVVTDDNGVQHQACVASAAATLAVPQRALAPRSQQATATTQTVLPATGAGTGGLIIAALLVGSGSVVSLLSRRRPSAVRKRFRRRSVTP